MNFSNKLSLFLKNSAIKKRLLATFPPILDKFRYLATIVVSLTPFRQNPSRNSAIFSCHAITGPGIMDCKQRVSLSTSIYISPAIPQGAILLINFTVQIHIGKKLFCIYQVVCFLPYNPPNVTHKVVPLFPP